MNKSMLSALELTRNTLPASIIDEEGYSRLAFIAGKLPFELATFWGFECRLGEIDAKVDVLFEIRKQSHGRHVLAGKVPSMLDSLCTQWYAWERLRRFAGLWADSDHEFSQYIRDVWLEFDTASSLNHSQMNEVLKQPCIFFGPDAQSLEKKQVCCLIHNTLTALNMPDVEGYALETFIAGLPEDAGIFQVGLMLARPNPGLRVCVKRLKAEDIPGWLNQIHWQGAEKIGIECYMNWFSNDPVQWLPLLNIIKEMNLILPSKYQGLMDYQGVTRVPGDWQRYSEGIVYTNLYRKIHHIKFGIAADTVTEVKAYLALNHPGFNVRAMLTKGAWLVE
jgi:hypothetical protein